MTDLGWVVAALLAALGHDDPRTRDASSEALYRLDPRRELREARRRAPDDEVRARLDDLLARLAVDDRIARFGGGPRLDGLAMSLRTDRFHGRGPFRLSVEIMNVGKEARTFDGLGTWDLERPDEDSRVPADARVSIRNVFAVGLRKTRWGRAEGSSAVPVTLRPGDVVAYAVVVDTLPAGDYEVRVDAGRLRSNPVRLLVRP